MGKRSAFARRAGDAYPTPIEAVLPLIPHLRGVRNFAEPCAGDGALIRHLESLGLRCVYSGDIRSGQDALALDHYGAADAIINKLKRHATESTHYYLGYWYGRMIADLPKSTLPKFEELLPTLPEKIMDQLMDCIMTLKNKPD